MDILKHLNGNKVPRAEILNQNVLNRHILKDSIREYITRCDVSVCASVMFWITQLTMFPSPKYNFGPLMIIA